MAEQTGKLVVVSGPSGAGKSTVITRLMQMRSDLCFSVSATTRQPRPSETEGKDYFFVTREEFDRMVEEDALLEHAEYVGNCYGTPRSYVERKRAEGLNVLLDIEVQGARQVCGKTPDAIAIFVIPPSLEELEHRLRGRHTDAEEKICCRLKRAHDEYREADFYEYIVINDDPEQAAREVDAIITAEKCRYQDRKSYLTEVQES